MASVILVKQGRLHCDKELVPEMLQVNPNLGYREDNHQEGSWPVTKSLLWHPLVADTQISGTKPRKGI